MTEAEWLTTDDALKMSEFVWSETRTKVDRKLAWFGVAICEQVRSLIRHPAVEKHLDRAAKAADGSVDPLFWRDGFDLGGRLENDTRRGWADAEWRVRRTQTESAESLASVVVPFTISCCFASYGRGAVLDLFLPVLALAVVRKRLPKIRVSIDDVVLPDRLPTDPTWRRANQTERIAQAAILRCIVGNPFRRVEVEPHWVTTTVLALAAAIYAARAFDRLPVLADALEEAGCDNADVLAHCRGDGPHARGCWVVDLVLGKT